MSKVYAVQVAPEYQSTGFYDVNDLCEAFGCGDDFIIRDNFDYNGYASEKIKSILDVLDDDWSENYEKLDELKEIETRTLNRSERKRIIELLEYYDEYYVDQEKFRCEFLEAVTGKKWESGTIHGSSQGEWENIYYVKDEFSKITINTLESYYFNEGSEWIVYELEHEIKSVSELDNEDGFSVYCTEWSDDGIREEIAGACYNVNPVDVVLLVFDGYTQTPKYEMRFAKENSVSENVPVAA